MDEIAHNLWFSTDVVILRAETRIFRVFAAILKAQCSVFADLFSLPQSADTETMDGHPVITLHDKAADVEVFLKAIFDSSFFMPPPAEIQFEDALAILRLSHKYDVGYLRRRALQHLGPIYPTTLAEYDARPGDCNAKSSPDTTFIRRTNTLKVAAEVGASWLLPVVYYDICKRDLARILAPGSSWHDLGENERSVCLTGYSAQITYLPKVTKILSVAKAAGDACDHWETCNIRRLKLNFATDVSHLTHFPLDLWTEDRVWGQMRAFGLCNRCVAETKSLHAAAGQELWDRLPQMFGLPGWEELEKLKREALAA